MAMTTSRNAAQINVTPLIDVLLVLLIIFMVITPTQSLGLVADVPQPALDQDRREPVPSTIVLAIDQYEKLTLNSQPVMLEELPGRLREIFARRALKVIFLKGANEIEFARIANLIDVAKGSGIDHVALLTN